MSTSAAAWQRLWGGLGAAGIPMGVYNRLVAAYSEQHRHYHTLQHLRECLAHLDATASLARHSDEVELALWFHDAVYDPRRDDNELRSADWAADALRSAGCGEAVASRVHALVLATRAHEAGDDPDVRLLVDIDLAILGTAPARYGEYARQVRAEYAHVPHALFRTRRAALLEALLARERIYATDAFHAALEQRARANLATELDTLRG